MGSSEWFELETLNDEITHSQSRLGAARKAKNHERVEVLEREIAEAEERRAQLLGHITTQLAHPIRDARNEGEVCRLRAPPPAASVSPRG